MGGGNVLRVLPLNFRNALPSITERGFLHFSSASNMPAYCCGELLLLFLHRPQTSEASSLAVVMALPVDTCTGPNNWWLEELLKTAQAT